MADLKAEAMSRAMEEMAKAGRDMSRHGAQIDFANRVADQNRSQINNSSRADTISESMSVRRIRGGVSTANAPPKIRGGGVRHGTVANNDDMS